MTSKPTSDYGRILQLGLEVAQQLPPQRPSNMFDWAQVETVWHQLELRLRTLHGYDVLSGMQDRDVPVLLLDLRRRLHYWATGLLVEDYLDLLALGNAELVLRHAEAVAREDQAVLIAKGQHYGDSWKRRGGVGAFMMLARKWDRLDNLLSGLNSSGQELLAALRRNPGNVQDDVHDLRRYALLVEDEVAAINARLDGPGGVPPFTVVPGGGSRAA